MPSRQEIVELMLTARRSKGVSFAQLGELLGRHPIWVAAAMHGQASLSAEEAAKLVAALGLDGQVAQMLQECPSKGALGQTIPTDPLIYRFYEIMHVYGPAIKEIIHEKFGDGIMSAIDFEIDIQKKPDPKGDRVVVTLNGKFLPYRKW